MPRRKRTQIVIPFKEPEEAVEDAVFDRRIDRLLEERLRSLAHRRQYREAPPERRSELRRETYVEALSDFLRDARERLRSLGARAPVRRALRAYAAAIDRTVTRIHSIAQSEVRAAGRWRRTEGESAPSLAIIATGGYGRRDLCPHSDVDIAVVPAPAPQPAAEELLKAVHRLIIGVLQDGCGVEVGWAYRPVSEVGSLDEQTQTALLDSRLIVGEGSLHEALLDRLYEDLDVLAFIQAKERERNARLFRSSGSPLRLEPNLKESPGGLRDIQTVRWIGAAKYGVRTAEALAELEDRGILSAQDVQALEEAEDFLLRLRTWLHVHAGERRDTLFLPSQNAAARSLGYEARDGHPPDIALMREYYDHARRVARVCEKAIGGCLAEGQSLAAGFVAAAGRLTAESERVFREDPANLIRVFGLAQRYSLDIAPELATLIDANLHLIDDGVREGEAAAEAFRSILGAGRGTSAALTAMSELGVLGRYLPEFGAIETLAPRDPSHEYTVGEHSLRAVGNLERVMLAEGDSELQQLKDAYESVADAELLVLAVLLHDSGKADAARDHCEAGADVAGRVAERLGFAPGRCEQLRDLIRKHLFLARTARLEDVALPGTIQRFAQRIGDVETLHMLFVLTYADTLAVTPAAWSDVTRQQTEDLYFRTLKLLLSGMSDEEVAQQIQRVREQVIRRLAAGARVAEARARAHCEAMPDSYLVHTPVGTIAQHIAFAERLPREGPILEFYDGPGQDFTELTICCRDDPEPGLFAKIAGVLYANDINVHTAQIYTRSSDDIVFDVLWIDFHGRQVTSAKRATLTRELIETFTGRTSVAELLDKKRKREPEPLDVAVLRASNQISEDHTVVQVTAEDQPGLLYRVTQALAACGLDIHTAKITTWRGKAEDAFYVTDADGGQVAEEILQEVEGRLRSLLVRK